MTIPTMLNPSRISADEYWLMLEDLTSGSFFWDPAADCVEWSPKLHNALGYTPEEAAKLVDIEGLLHPDDRQAHGEALSQSMATGSSYSIEIRLRNFVGRFQHFQVQGFWLSRNEEPAGLLSGFLTEISDLAKVREKAMRSEGLFRAFFDNVPAAVYIKNSNQQHLYGNELAAKIAGCSLEDFLSKRTPELFDAETAKILESVDRRILDGGEIVARHGEFKTESGDFHYVYDTTFPIHDPITNETLIGGVGLDTTQQHEMEKALAHSKKLEALGQLVGGIAHDFNNTLAVLQGNLDLVKLIEDDAEIETCFEEFANAIERGRRLTLQLLAYGRKSVLAPTTKNLTAIISDADRMLRRILPETIMIETVAGGGLWNTHIDKSQVENAILNLALNSRDAMPSGGKLTIETTNVRIDESYVEDRAEDLEPGRFVMLAVTDTGVGMPKEISDRAFDPFFTTKNIDKGSGMGLAMVLGLMRQIGGTARAYSELGVGTTIKLYFPATHEEIKTDIPKPKPIKKGKEHILLAEDDDSVRDMLRRQLQALGYKVTEAENGDKALEILIGDLSIEMLVTDIVMPGILQGPSLAKQARENRPNLPVLFMSGYPREASIHGNGLRPDDIKLMKPVSIADLATAISQSIEFSKPGS